MTIIQHLLFDLDGTLIDSAPSILKSFAAALAQYEIAPIEPLTDSIIGPPLRQTLRNATGIENEARLAMLADAFKAHYDEAGYVETEVYPGIVELLGELMRRGNRLYIVTNKRIAPTRKILDHLGWTQWFAGVYAQDAFATPLPSKAAVIGEVLARHGISATNAVYIGDRQEDGEAAMANQLRFFWARWGYGDEMDPRYCDDTAGFDTPDQLIQAMRA